MIRKNFSFMKNGDFEYDPHNLIEDRRRKS